MKLLLKCIVIQLCFTVHAFAQQNPDANVPQLPEQNVVGDFSKYLFPEFTEGRAYLQDGSTANTVFNYNILTYEMLFQNANDEVWALETKNVNYVQIQGKRYIPFKKGFVEILKDGKVALALFRELVLVNDAKSAYGIKMETSSIKHITEHQRFKGPITDMSERYRSKMLYTFYLMKNGKLYKADKKAFMKCFEKDKVKALLAENTIDFEKVEDLMFLLSKLQD